MAKKSITRMLSEASALAALVKITQYELVSFSCWHDDVRFHLKPEALARAFRVFNVSAKALEVIEQEGNVHFAFDARGCRWVAVLLKDEVENWKRLAFPEQRKLISRQPRLNAPSRHLMIQKTLALACDLED